MAKTVGFNFSVGARLQSSVATVFDTVAGRTRKLSTDLRQLRAVSKVAGSVTATRERLNALKDQAAAGKDVSKELMATEKAYARAVRAAKKYNIAIADSAKVHAQANAQMKRTEEVLERQRVYQRNRAKRSELRGEIMGTVASVAAVAVPVKMAMDYEGEFADLKKAADFASKADEDLVKKDIFSVAKMSGLSAANVTSIATSAAESGVVKTASGDIDPEALKEFLQDAAMMAVAMGISAEEAGERMKAMRTRMGLTAQETRELNDSINWMGANMNATAEATSRVVARMGGVGDMAGLSAKSVAALSATLVATSESPEVAGTAFKNFVITLSKGEHMTKKQKKTLNAMGVDVQNLAEELNKGGASSELAILGVLKAIQKMPEAEMAGIANELFGSQSIASLAPLIKDLGSLEKAFKLAHSEEAKGSQLKEFEDRMNTTQEAIKKARVSLSIMAITIGAVALPAVTSMADAVTSFLGPVTAYAQENPKVVSGVMGVAGALVALKVVTLAARFAFTGLSDTYTFLRGATSLVSLALNRQTYAMIWQRTVSFTTATGIRAVAMAQRLLNLTMSNNPIGWVIKGGILLGTVLYALYKRCEPVRRAFHSIWDGVLAVMEPVTSKVAWLWDKISGIMGWFKSDSDKVNKKADEKIAQKSKTVAKSEAVASLSPVRSNSISKSNVTDLDFEDSKIQADFNKYMAGAPDINMNMQGFDLSAYEVPSHKERGVCISPVFNLYLNIDGIPDKDFGTRVVESVESKKSEIERILSGLLHDAQRTTYG